MSQLVLAYWPVLLVAFALGMGAAWFIFVLRRRTSVVGARRDVLDEGAEPARRNQALIDAGRDLPPQILKAAAPPPADGDDLTRIKGLGPKIAAILHSQGITTYRQIAQWDAAEAARIDALLGRFSGRVGRDAWIRQAKFLADGDEAGFAASFGRDG